MNDAVEKTPAESWEANATRRVLDELFCFARQYRSSEAYQGLLKFIVRFKRYSPFNAMLVRTQLAGATFVLTAHRWAKDYGRKVKVGARPLVILQPMGPIMFVFDVSDTEPIPGVRAKPLPREVTHPFEVLPNSGQIGREWDLTVLNAKRDGICVESRKEGWQFRWVDTSSGYPKERVQITILSASFRVRSLPGWHESVSTSNGVRRTRPPSCARMASVEHRERGAANSRATIASLLHIQDAPGVPDLRSASYHTIASSPVVMLWSNLL